MRFGRRPLFFLAVAVVSLLLLIPTPSDFRWVNVTMAGLASFWFVLLGIEEGQNNRVPTEFPAAIPGDIEREERP